MKKQIVLIFSLLVIWVFVNCNNVTSSASCKNNCNEKENICLITVANLDSSAMNLLGCEVYKSSCVSGCTSSSSNSSSSSTRSSGGGSRTSSSGSRSNGSGSSSSSGGSSGGSGGGSSGGSGGSSHSITADTGN